MRRKRVLFTLTDLHAGGAQRVVLTLLRHLPRDEFELAVALVRREGAFLGEIPQDVPVHDLGAKRVRQAGPAIVRLARRERPDVLFSTLSYLNNYVLLLRPFLPRTTRIVVREAIAVSSAVRTWRMPWLWPLLFRLLYRRADAILCQCRFMGDDLVRSFGVPREKIRTIYNPVDAERVRASSRNARRNWLITIATEWSLTASRPHTPSMSSSFFTTWPAFAHRRTSASIARRSNLCCTPSP